MYYWGKLIKKKRIVFSLFVICLFSFQTNSTAFYIAKNTQRDTTLSLQYKSFEVKVLIRFPQKSSGKTLMLLHGYNLPYTQWCEKTSLCKLALDSGYTLIIPELGKTTYHYKIYKETIAKYRLCPTRKWMLDTLIPHLQKELKLLIPGQKNYLAGISTGARGAALLANDLPEIFKATACLSGDFDQTKLPWDQIYNGYYGSYKTNTQRWKTDDNIQAMAGIWQVPVFLAHGKKDKICPYTQTVSFYNRLKELGKSSLVQLSVMPEGMHDYQFWESQTLPVLKFFNRY